MKRQVVLVLLLCLLLGLAGCVGGVPNFVDATRDPVQAYADANRSQATAQAAQATADFYGSQLTATVEAANAHATEQAWQATNSAEIAQSTQQALLLFAQLTSTERAWQSTATADSANATSTAAGTATAQSWQATATQAAWDITRTVDAAGASALATIQAAEARRVELSLEREQMMNQVRAIAPWFGLLVTLVLFMVILWQRSRLVFVGRDKYGDTPKVLVHQAGHIIAYDSDRSFSPVLDITPDGKAQMPLLAPPNAQAEVTGRDQMIDLARILPRLGERKIREALPLSRPMPSLPANTPQIEVIDAAQVRPWLEEVQSQLLTEETQ